MYEQSSGSRFGPAFIAVLVVLAAVTGTIAYVVARQVMDNQGPAVAGETPDPSDEPGGPGEPGPTGDPGPTGGPDPTDGPTDPGGTPPAGTKDCPRVTEQAAVTAGSPGGLKQVLYVQTRNSEVWICRDSGGELWYQGHSPRSEPLQAATSTVSLFLDEVRAEGEAYIAVNRGESSTTTYRVTRTELRVDNPPITEPVIFSEG